MKTKYMALSSPIAFGDVISFSATPENVGLTDGVSIVDAHVHGQEIADDKQWFVAGTYNFSTNIFTVGDGGSNLVLIDKNLAQIHVDGGNWGLA